MAARPLSIFYGYPDQLIARWCGVSVATARIKDAGPKKIEVIKVIRQLTSLGLGEAKSLAETAGSKVLSAVGKEAAMDAKKKLEEAGAVVEVA